MEDMPCVVVVGLGYVGLALATAFAKKTRTIGFDINPGRVEALRQGIDANGEAAPADLQSPHLTFTADPAALRKAQFIIVAVPTPVDAHKRPDLSHLTNASRLVGQNLSPGAIVIYESTVYPGVTEEICLPILEEASGLKAGRDFKIAYSPERVNPGDPEHTLEKIVKVVAAQDKETLEKVAWLYGLVVKAGVYRAPNIKTAEAAKVIENIQRDLNIALMNELALIFHRLGLDTREVLAAARTKWNFLPFEPGLVGGHCIPVDPYYLTYKAEETGYHPEVILAGRRINDQMGLYVAQQTVKLLIRSGKAVLGAKALVLGVTFKENVRDVRNSRVADLVQEITNYGVSVVVYDPLIEPEKIRQLGLEPVSDPFAGKERYDAVILAVPHRAFREKGPGAYIKLLDSTAGPGVIVDVRRVLPKDAITSAGAIYWGL
ncbi:UDP-N-acetyl-D-galactosamine dehydrogenase [Thermodesulfitimonas autotrophica]|uniref:UDP-N-acetyl-D-galactosamine dehydrogenase n=1 Tax=Thermodesulfitimonas autotrophica TaxID=1894989 RepID=A0A3N5BG12_9THEO|nr:nucleotide sugar dehydrogenase [Thermodesulfitimonas autotrophica]RPF47012.1 UDP-N-acetyl-D-galactosamine dehydrogenase [Thermodesulfitimonas autotrophica]